jgi:hypothetical protein
MIDHLFRPMDDGHPGICKQCSLGKGRHKPLMVGTGMPASTRMNGFGQYIYDAYGHIPYHVGSSLRGKEWRDVDIRLILPDDEFSAMFPGYARAHQIDARWSLICEALSELGAFYTHLPIDFQIQSQKTANRYDGPRNPLFRIAHESIKGTTEADLPGV